MVSAGRILIMPKGDWSNLVSYDMLDLVSYNGVAYLARQASAGVNPATDTSYTYWQPFGSASSIATPTTPGLVMPDDRTLKVDATGLINVNIDGSTIKYDATNDYIYTDITIALSALTDVNIASASNGQALVYDSTSGKWENSNISASSVTYSNTSSGMVATNVQAAIDEVEGRVDTAEGSITSLSGRMTTAEGNITNNNTAQNNKHKVTSKSVATTGWTADTASQSGTTLYKKTISLSHVYITSPIVDIGASGVLPTVAQQEAYDLLQYVTINGTTLTLYSSAIPTTAYYINITGAD